MTTAFVSRPAVHDVAIELSHRLCSWQVRIVDLATKLDAVDEFAAPVVLRCEVRNEFRDIVSPTEDLFAQENAMMVQVERDAEGAVRWDEGLLAEPALLGAYGISHYLLDAARIGQVMAAVMSHQALNATSRRQIMSDAI